MKMNYFVLGTDDLEQASNFYNALFDGQGLHSVAASERMTYWLGDDFAFALALPFDGKPATNGNGTMLGVSVGSPEAVDKMHARALELGAQDEGAPGPRGPKYSAYIRDRDGNKLCLSD